jgi:hypothetical protein
MWFTPQLRYMNREYCLQLGRARLERKLAKAACPDPNPIPLKLKHNSIPSRCAALFTEWLNKKTTKNGQ